MGVDAVRIGLIGAGGIARTHAEHLKRIPGVRIAAVIDPARDRAEVLAGRFGARVHDELRPLLDEVDAVYVCSPPTMHREHVVAAAAAGKHVYCEKPIATTLEDGRAIAEALSLRPVCAMVGFNNRFRPSFRRWRDLAREGRLGSPASAWILRAAPATPLLRGNWRTDPGQLCGVTIESASHDIDLVRWALGEVVSVAGSTASSLPDLPGFDDTLNAVLRLETGAAVTLTVSWSSTISMSSRGIIGTGGAVCLLGRDMWTVSELRWARSGETEVVEPIDPEEGADGGYRGASEHFVTCIREGREPEVTVGDGLAALEVSLALLTSAAEGTAVATSG